MTDLLPIFPLANVVLFPKARVPLHVFEPRYRAMTAEALAGRRQIGMVTVHPDHVDALDGDPPVFQVGCAGVITEASRLPDGRYNLVVLGTHRFRIVEEPARPQERLYRVARVEPLEDHFESADAARVAALRAKVIELFADLMRSTSPRHADEVRPALFAGVEDVVFVNTLCQVLELPAAEKQGLLEADDIPLRFDRLRRLLDFRLAELRAALPPSPRAIH